MDYDQGREPDDCEARSTGTPDSLIRADSNSKKETIYACLARSALRVRVVRLRLLLQFLFEEKTNQDELSPAFVAQGWSALPAASCVLAQTRQLNWIFPMTRRGGDDGVPLRLTQSGPIT